jgi:xylulokinase
LKIAGLDIGTTGCKLTVFNEKGSYLDKAYCDYPVQRGKSEHEVDASAIREGVFEVIRVMAAKYSDIAGIGVTSFGETFVLTDQEGIPLLPSMLYTDPRGAEECAELVEKLGQEVIADITGLKPHEMFSIAKLMWVKKHRPDIYRDARHVFLMEDYIVYLLSGITQIDYSLASRTMAFDIRGLKWSDEIFEAAGIAKNLFSSPVPTGTAAGKVTSETTKQTGLSEDTIIVSISHDQVAAAIGSGVFDCDKAVDGAGTVECITPVFDKIPENKVMFDGNYSIVPYIIPGKYVCYAFSYTGGSLISWCINTLAKQEAADAKISGGSVFELLEKKEKEEPTGILVLPHFAGAATPYMDTGSKGAIVGLTLAHTVNDIYQACMEGVVYEMMLNAERISQAGINYEMLHATGGGAHSKVWMQMKADALGIPVATLESDEAGTVGSAMLTGIVVGCFQDLEDAKEHMVKIKSYYYPREEQHQMYQELYKKYRGLYEAVRPLV